MKNYPAANIRNVVLMGHGGSGKTAFAETVLYNAKAIDRMGKSTDGNTVLDFDPEEIRRQISLNTATAACEIGKYKLNIVDTPGDFDFQGEVLQGLHVADSALIVISAKDGLSVGAEKAMRLTEERSMPAFFLINRLDEPNADYAKALESLTEAYGQNIVPFTLPIMEGETMVGIVDVIEQKAYELDAKTQEAKAIDMPADCASQVEGIMESLNELIAENDEELMEKFFNDEPFSEEEMSRGLRLAIEQRSVCPVYVGSATANWGIRFTTEQLLKFAPAPTEKAAIAAKTPTGEALEVKTDDDGPLAAFVFKTIVDPFVGRISFFRVYSGTFSSNSTVYNPTKEKDERVASVFCMRGKKQIQTEKITAGDIGAVTKLLVTTTNDTLCDRSKPVILPTIEFPVACLSMAIKPVKKGEEDKIMQGLNKLKDEDLVFDIENDAETHQMLLSGLGEQQLDVLRSKLKQKYNVEAVLEEARVPYRETVRKKVRIQGKHKKQSGGHGQYGDVWIEFEPGEEEGLTFEQKIFGGSVPKSFHPAVEKGLQDAIKEGVLAGYPVVNLKAVLVDGSYHDVDSSEMAFRLAARLAYRNGLPKADPVLLEPISSVEIHIPDDYLGDVMGDLNKRRGRIMGINPEDGEQVVSAEVPSSEMTRYATDLKSMTQGRGWFKIDFARYETAPQSVADKVIAEAQAKAESEDG